MPSTTDFNLYFNIAFFSALGLGILFGFLKGFKKSLWTFLVTMVFFAFFFLTIDIVVNKLWTINMSFLGGLLQNISPELSSASSLSEALPLALQAFLPADFSDVVANENLITFLSSLALFVVKIAYTIIYFTVIQIIYRLVLWIIKMIVSPSKSKTDKYKSKNRGFGALFGLLQGGISLYVTLIIFGGVMSISESLVNVLPQESPQTMSHIEYRMDSQNPTQSLITLAALDLPDVSGIEEATDMLTGMVEAYNANPIVVAQNKLTMTSEYNQEEVPLNLYLFDSVMSLTYKEEQIAIRAELDIYSDLVGTVLSSDFIESSNLSDITDQEITDVFTSLSQSNLITSILPLGIEVASEYFDNPIDMPLDDLYDIDWETELDQLGTVAIYAVTIINSAGILNENFDIETVELSGADVSGLFSSLGNSQLVTLAADVAVDSLLEDAEGDIKALINVPVGINWTDELTAIGAFAGAVLTAGLTMETVNNGDVSEILTIVSNVNLDLLLDSSIIKNAIINILEGRVSSIDIGQFITVPNFTDAEWDTELANILSAISALSSSAANLDFQNPSIDMIAELSADDINTLFESKILVATITKYIKELPLGDYTVIMPDTAFDAETGYLLKIELTSIVDALFMMLDVLACPVDDTECEELGFDVGSILTLNSGNIDTLLLSKILSATVGNMVIDFGADILTIPNSALTEITVETVAQNVVSKTEIKNAFLAITTLGITDIDNLEIDPSILSNLAESPESTVLDTDKSDILFSSIILNATLSKYLLDFADAENALVTVPYFTQLGAPVRTYIAADEMEIIEEDELTNILQAILTLDIEDFEALDTLDINTIIPNVSTLLASSILHATVSKQLLDLDEVVAVPLNDELGEPILITVGTEDEKTTYIDSDELIAVFDALKVLDIEDVNNIAMDMSIIDNLEDVDNLGHLDEDKSSILFGSAILNATLAKYLIDFTEGDDPFVVVPYKTELNVVVRTVDSEDGTNYISEAELTNVLKAVFALDIEDFETMDTIDVSVLLGNVDTLLDSAILQATITKQLLDIDIVVVPAEDELAEPIRITTGDPGFQTEFIKRAELTAVFEALDALGIEDVDGLEIDTEIINNLEDENVPNTLDDDKSEKLFSSAIINATISKYIFDFSTGDDPFLVVPYKDQGGTDVVKVSNVDGTEVITEIELRKVLEAILVLDIENFDEINDFSLDTIIANKSTLLASSILQASISKQLIDLGSDLITIPVYYEDDEFLKITQGSVTFIDSDELENTFDALKVLEINSIDGIAVDITILDRLEDEENPGMLDTDKSDDLFASTIIKATLSKYIIDFSEGESAVLTVPYQDESFIDIRTKTLDDIQLIKKQELENLLAAIIALDLETFDDVDGLSMTKLIDNKTTILASTIFQATISDQIIGLGAGILIVPEKQEDNLTDVLVTTGAILEEETTFITYFELDALLEALRALNMEDIDSFGGSFDLTLFKDHPERIDAMVASSIIQATVSEQVFDVADDDLAVTSIIVPYKKDLGGDDLRVTVGVDNPVEMIIKTEIKDLIEAFVALEFASVDDLGAELSISSLADNRVALFESYIIQATVSKQVLDKDVTDTIVVPYYDNDNLTRVRNISGPVGETTEFITKAELEYLMLALDILIPEGTGVDGFDGSIDITLFFDQVKRQTLIDSAVLQATISDQLIELEPTIVVPTTNADDSLDINYTVGVGVEQNLYITQTEIHNLFIALEVLGFSSIDDLGGDILLDDLFASNSDSATALSNQNKLLGSSIMQATISKQISDVASLRVPTQDQGNAVIKTTNVSGDFYIYTAEIKHLFNALDILGESDITDFSGDVSLTNLFASNSDAATALSNQNTLLSSAIVHATITDQIFALDGDTLIIPVEDIVTAAVQYHTNVNSDFYLVKTEIKSLLNALDILGFSNSNIADFDGDIDISVLNNISTQTSFLSSATMHATVSDKLIDLPDDVLIVPIHTEIAETLAQEIRQTVSGTEFVIKSEIYHIIDAFIDMDVDLNSLNIDSQKFFDDPDLYLLSSSIQATLSDKLFDINDPTTIILYPDQDSRLAIRATAPVDIVIKQTDVTYIELVELKALLDAMEEMQLTNFATVTITTNAIFGKDYATILTSAIMQATISDKLLEDASNNPNTATPNQLIVPDVFRENITVNSISEVWIERVELINLLTSLDMLDLGAFGDSVDGSTLTSMTSGEMDILLASGSMHTTISQMMKGNASVNGNIPDLAMDDLYGLTDIVIKSEIKAFITACNTLSAGSDMTTLNINLALITGKTPAERDIILDSMIVRNIITPDLEAAADLHPTYAFVAADYESNPVLDFLTKAACIDAIDTMYP